jgi:hypothetical protein
MRFSTRFRATTYKEKLKKHGVIFCSFTEAIRDYPELVKKYLGSVVPTNDNFFAAVEQRGLLGWKFLFHSEGRAAVRWSCRLTSASTTRSRDSLSDADRAEEGFVRFVSRRMYGAEV